MSSSDPPNDARVGEFPTVDSLVDAGQRDSSTSTVGTGSALGIGCLIAVVVLVVVAVAARWLMGAW